MNEVPDWIAKAIESGESHDEPRETFNEGSEEIINHLFRIEHKIDDLIAARQPPTAVHVAVRIPMNDMASLLGAIAGSRKLETIKYIRQLTGCGLKEAVDLLDAYWSEIGN